MPVGRVAWLVILMTASPCRAAHWTGSDVSELLGVIASSQEEGLRPAAYSPQLVRQALTQDDPALDSLADRSALALAHDYGEGAVPSGLRRDWHIPRGPSDYRAWLENAMARHDLSRSYAALLPDMPAYRTLKIALRACRERNGDCTAILASMERWRWLPRELGEHYLWVNVAAFRLDDMMDGEIVTSRRIIVGKPTRQTPQFRTVVTGVTINPWWNVPCSILPEGIGRMVRRHPQEAARRGYVASRGKGGQLEVRQRPGPDNALGRVKLEMSNPYHVYIHDTPSRALFETDVRAYSHGCIRADQPLELAATLLSPDQMMAADAVLATSQTKTFRLAHPLPVYVVYQTAEPDPQAVDGVAVHDDLYHRDAALMPFLSLPPKANSP